MPQNAKPKNHGIKVRKPERRKAPRDRQGENLTYQIARDFPDIFSIEGEKIRVIGAVTEATKAMTEQAIEEMLERKHAKNNHKKSQKKHGQK